MNTTTKVFKYDCPQEEWKEFIQAMNSGNVFEVDEENYFYWLEVLPPKFYGVKELDGRKRQCFGFAEGRDYITYFWKEGGRFFGQRSNDLNTRD